MKKEEYTRDLQEDTVFGLYKDKLKIMNHIKFNKANGTFEKLFGLGILV